jgi:hypothetical protein
MVRMATRTKQHELARAILDDWEKVAPNDPAMRRMNVEVRVMTGDLTGAVFAARGINEPAVQKLRQFALDEIEKLLKKER